jgi:hypothetical protein
VATQPPASPDPAPTAGILTWDAEGTEGGRFHSRKLHVPSPSSGLTIGRGYDFKQKTAADAAADLTRAGLSPAIAQTLARAVGLAGAAAQQFIADNALAAFEITKEQQLALFNISYANLAADVKRICASDSVVRAYGATNWVSLHAAIKDVLVDLRFRGDYHVESRKLIQKHVASNDLAAFVAVMCAPNNWVQVPRDRFQRRVAYLQAATRGQGAR